MLFAIIASPILVYAGLAAWQHWPKISRNAWTAACAALLLLFVVRLFRLGDFSVDHPPLWDAMCFWLYGRVAWTSHEVYVPAAYHALAQHFAYLHRADFSREVLDVGFPYPPFTIPLVTLLGFFASPGHALVLWYGLDAIAIAAIAIVAWRRFFSAYGWAGLLGCALTIVACSMVAAVIEIAQTVLLLLMFIVLYEADRSDFRRGIWLGLACVVKPFAFIFFLYPLLRRRWAELGGALATLATATMLGIAIVHWNNFMVFFTSPPYHRATPEMYTEITNQSLYAAVLRAGFHYPLYATLFAVLLAFAALVCIFAKEQHRDLCLSMLLSIALLVYPAALSFYAVALLFSIWTLWKYRAWLGMHGTPVFVAFTALFYALSSTRLGAIEMAAPVATLLMTAWILLRCTAGLQPVRIAQPVARDAGSVP